MSFQQEANIFFYIHEHLHVYTEYYRNQSHSIENKT